MGRPQKKSPKKKRLKNEKAKATRLRKKSEKEQAALKVQHGDGGNDEDPEDSYHQELSSNVSL